ncbi:MAG: hypothetical protein FK730_13725 [Asgard group archaeon]|nr:hypothetical protein [Asgard group archaeon]
MVSVKAFFQLEIKLPVNKMIYVNNDEGLPTLIIDQQALKPEDREILKSIVIRISLTHTKEIGTAIVLVIKQ